MCFNSIPLRGEGPEKPLPVHGAKLAVTTRTYIPFLTKLCSESRDLRIFYLSGLGPLLGPPWTSSHARADLVQGDFLERGQEQIKERRIELKLINRTPERERVVSSLPPLCMCLYIWKPGADRHRIGVWWLRPHPSSSLTGKYHALCPYTGASKGPWPSKLNQVLPLGFMLWESRKAPEEAIRSNH